MSLAGAIAENAKKRPKVGLAMFGAVRKLCHLMDFVVKVFAVTPTTGRVIMFSEDNKHCRECFCVTCLYFHTDECLDGEDMCDKCDNQSHTENCPWFDDSESMQNDKGDK